MTEIPAPSVSEIETLKIHIVAWADRTVIQQAICLAVLRGHCYLPHIASYLEANEETIERNVGKLIGKGLLWDNHKLLLH